jgi:hypothetical protein
MAAKPLKKQDWRLTLRGAWVVRLTEGMFADYLIAPAGIDFVATLWAIATYLFEVFDSFAYLTITSPTKGCGKSQFAEILELLCCRPMLSVNVSEAALFRSIENDKPTVIIDEAEALRNRTSERARYLLSILQAGYKKGAVVPRCVGRGHEVEKFSVFCPKAIVAIGNLPDTLVDRSIVVLMRRHLESEKVKRFRRRIVTEEATRITGLITAWIHAHKQEIAQAYLKQNLEFLRDREAEIWEPLFAVAAIACPERLEDLKQIAIRLSGKKTEMDVDESQGLRLLADIRAIFEKTKRKAIRSADLVKWLRKEAANHWGDELTETKLAGLLRPFGIGPKQVWMNANNVRGYRREDFKSAFARYLPAESH